MPHTIIFDTNYIKSFGPREYLSGKLPPKMVEQINRAFGRGELIALHETVRIETNAWLTDVAAKNQQRLTEALETLTNAGHTVMPPSIKQDAAPDVLVVMQETNNNISLLTPTIQDYREAERRTSYRLPPLPKNIDGEEMRDRLIWCHLLRYSAGGQNPVLIVSGDHLFMNGANSDEGKVSKINRVEGETDLDQHLGARPLHIEEIVDKLLDFSAALCERGITLTAANILQVEELRNVRQLDGSVSQRFSLITSSDSGLPSPAPVILTVIGDEPISVAITAGEVITVTKAPMNAEKVTLTQVRRLSEDAHAAAELRRLVGRGP